MAHRILLVDDEPRNLRLLSAMLEPHGYQILTASGGRAALSLVESESIDLALLDVSMPEVDGFAVLRSVRARPDAEYMPIVLVTANSDYEVRLQGLDAGADEFLEKPVDRSLLLARVKTLLRWGDAQKALRSQNTQLVEMARDREELSQFLVHDLKNPLSVLAANLEYIETVSAPEQTELREAARDAQDASTRLARMVEDLLTVTKMERAELKPAIERFRVADLFADISRSQSRNASTRRIAVEAEVQEGVEIRADRGLMSRVLENLADNALRYTPSGGSVRFIARGGADVEIGVANTGKGIPIELRERIFEKFYRGDGAGRCNVGLGLNFCHQAVRAHGGQIRVIDTPEWATMFLITIPQSSGAS